MSPKCKAGIFFQSTVAVESAFEVKAQQELQKRMKDAKCPIHALFVACFRVAQYFFDNRKLFKQKFVSKKVLNLLSTYASSSSSRSASIDTLEINGKITRDEKNEFVKWEGRVNELQG